MRPVPDELWLPLQRRYERTLGFAKACMGVMVICAALLIVATWLPARDALRLINVVGPVSILALIGAGVAMSRCRRMLAAMRRLMIEYHGIDPDGP